MGCARGTTQVGLPTGITRNLVELTAGLRPKPHQRAGQLAIKEGRYGVEVELSLSLPRLEVRPSPGRGFGLFAAEFIPAYTKILEDEALLSLAQGEDLPQLWEKYRLLPPEFQQSFDELSCPDELAAKQNIMATKLERRGYKTPEAASMALISSRWQANAFKTGAPNVESGGSPKWLYSLFARVARINHSCTPNAQSHYRNPGTEVLYAVHDIKVGDEIEIAYFDLTMARVERQQRAKSWGFQCTCPACSKLDAAARWDAYEQRLHDVRRVLSIGNNLPAMVGVTKADALKAISIAQSAEYPWLIITLPNLYLTLSILEVRERSGRDKAMEALKNALEWEERITGPNSPPSQRRREELAAFDADGSYSRLSSASD